MMWETMLSCSRYERRVFDGLQVSWVLSNLQVNVQFRAFSDWAACRSPGVAPSDRARLLHSG